MLTVEVVNFVDSVERGVEEIPRSLKKDDIFVVVLGGGYDDAAYETIKKAATGSEMKKVYWMRPDKTKPGPGDDMKAYSQVIAARTKVKLDEVRSGNIAEGELVLF